MSRYLRPLFFIVLLLAPVATGQTKPPAPDKPSAPGKPAETNGKPRCMPVPLISRQVLFGNPDRAGVQISHDGQHLSYLADADGVMNVWVAPLQKLSEAKQITRSTKRGIQIYFWAYNNEQIVYAEDREGDENWRINSADIRTGEVKELTPEKGVQARIQGVSPKFPDELLIALNDRTPQLHDLYRVNIRTGEKKLLMENDGFVELMTDDDYAVRFGVKFLFTGGTEIFERTPDGEWKSFAKIGPEDALTTSPIGFDRTGNVLYLIDSRDRNTAALVSMDLKAGTSTVLAEDPRADVSGVLAHPEKKEIEAVAFTLERKSWRVLDPRIKGDLAYLKTVTNGDWEVLDRSQADDLWVVAYVVDKGPVQYYLYDRQKKQATFLFTNRKQLQGLPLAAMHPVTIKSRDGMNLVSYLSLPVTADADENGRPEKPQPMVLLVHGGPWARDVWGYNSWHQWLANRGYAVLSVNFRGSTGFGKQFLNAANREWGGKMHDDLVDAVQWAVAEKIADPRRVAIMGGSYGGYATLVGVTFTPELFVCGVDIVGPSNLVTFMQTAPPYWQILMDMFTARIGDHRTEEGRTFLMERSPITRVDKIQRPLLIGQGANDPRVKQSESDQIVKAMQEKNIPVTYVLFPDEGHGFNRPENRLAFFAIAEAFLAEHVGGQVEPIGDDFVGSSVQVPSGADKIPGAAQKLTTVEAAQRE